MSDEGEKKKDQSETNDKKPVENQAEKTEENEKQEQTEKGKEAGEEGKEKKEKKKKEKKSQKERPKSKKKHTKVQIWKLYDGAKRKNPNCPRCGPGTFIAVYKNRKYCGKCGWAEAVSEKKTNK